MGDVTVSLPHILPLTFKHDAYSFLVRLPGGQTGTPALQSCMDAFQLLPKSMELCSYCAQRGGGGESLSPTSHDHICLVCNQFPWAARCSQIPQLLWFWNSFLRCLWCDESDLRGRFNHLRFHICIMGKTNREVEWDTQRSVSSSLKGTRTLLGHFFVVQWAVVNTLFIRFHHLDVTAPTAPLFPRSQLW